jgi:hypothetical protein
LLLRPPARSFAVPVAVVVAVLALLWAFELHRFSFI